MTKKTARGIRDDNRLPSQRTQPRQLRTRVDPFVDIWSDVEWRLEGELCLIADDVAYACGVLIS